MWGCSTLSHGGAGLVREAAAVLVALGQLLVQHLERDERAVLLAPGAVDDAHAALAEQRLEAVGPDHPAGGELGAGIEPNPAQSAAWTATR